MNFIEWSVYLLSTQLVNPNVCVSLTYSADTASQFLRNPCHPFVLELIAYFLLKQVANFVMEIKCTFRGEENAANFVRSHADNTGFVGDPFFRPGKLISEKAPNRNELIKQFQKKNHEWNSFEALFLLNRKNFVPARKPCWGGLLSREEKQIFRREFCA